MKLIWRIIIVAALAGAVAGVVALKHNRGDTAEPIQPASAHSKADTVEQAQAATGKTVRFVDLGADKCIPCKMMAPMLAELAKEYEGHLKVDFIDVWKNPDAGAEYGIRVIPTQVFFDASGKELFRHEGFFSKEDILAKWKELGYEFKVPKVSGGVFIERLVPAQADSRSRETICYMCDGTIKPKALVVVDTDKGPVRLCSPHCYFIMYSCLTEDKTGFEKKVSMTDWGTSNRVPVSEAFFLYGQDETTGRPWTRAFAVRTEAVKERIASGGNILAFSTLQEKELSNRCGFCDRACYPQDAATVIAGGVQTWGCCSHCAMGVAARTGLDIEVHERDRLTGETIVVKTFDGSVASIEPAGAVAWFGQRQKANGTWGSAGCFHQGFFVNPENLGKWLERNPYETGRTITINQALADKMKLLPEQIKKACKIGECSPK